jgi:TonB family protein
LFEAFQPAAADTARRRRLAVSAVTAVLTYSAAAGAAILLGRGTGIVQEKMLDVTFEKQLPKEVEQPPPPPPPPPPPKKIEKPKINPPPVVEAAPPPPAPPPVVVPKVVPKEVLPESDVAVAKREWIPPAEGIGGSSRTAVAGVPGGVPGGTGTAAPAAPRALAPVNLPEEATPPLESPANRRPEYPESARAAGLEGLVILKIVVTETGRVGNIQVMKGEPPFVDAAISVVKTYTFQPAMLAGRPIAVFRIIKVPFRLSVGGAR